MAGSDLNPTLNKSGQQGASPREYDQHQRHRQFSRVRHSQQELAYLQQQATRLGTTPAVIFAKLDFYSAERISAAANLAALPVPVAP
jgi:hypothetical protein